MEGSLKDVIFLLLKGKTKEAKLLLESTILYSVIRQLGNRGNK